MPVDTSPRRVWDAALGRLELQITRPSFETWLRGTLGVAVEGETLVVSVPTTFAAETLEQRMALLVDQAVAAVDPALRHVEFHVATTSAPSAVPQPTAPTATVVQGTPPTFTFNPNYTFDSFVVGPSNQLAYAASMAVAEAPGSAYNPLFLYGAVGLGKTHLLHAIGVAASARGKAVTYVTCEQFTNEFLTAIRERTTEQFRARYRNTDVLLIDDIQFISGKDGTQEGLFHTFNALHNAGRQIVLTSDRAPSALPLLEERLRSRFEAGLIADIGSPELETRIALIRHFTEQSPVVIPDDVTYFLAERISSSVRSIQGCLNRITATAQFTNVPVTTALAQSCIGTNAAQESNTNAPKAAIAAVAAHFNLTQAALVTGQRDRASSTARQLAMYVLDQYFHLPPDEIGSVLGHRDRTTVIYNVKRMGKRLSDDNRFAQEIQPLLETFATSP